MYKIALVLFGLAFIISCSEDEGSAPRAFFFVFQIVDDNGNDFFVNNEEYSNPEENLIIENSPNNGVLLGGFSKCLLSDSTLRISYETASPQTVYFNYGNGDIDTLFASYDLEKNSGIDISSAKFCFNNELCTKIDLDLTNRADYSISLRSFCTDSTFTYPLIKLTKR